MITSEATQSIWQSGSFVGANRAMHRVTIQDLDMLICPVDIGKTPLPGVGVGVSTIVSDSLVPPTSSALSNVAGLNALDMRLSPSQTYASAMFGQLAQPVELPNVKSCGWSRSTSVDAAVLTLVLYNCQPLPLGTSPENTEDFESVGYYTADRGTTSYSSRWGYSANGWSGRITPDKLLRTYGGFGFNASVIPEDDENLYLSGLWLIDDVVYTPDGLINISARDLGRVLIEQICFPPVVPFSQYPLDFLPYKEVPNAPVPVVTGGWTSLSYASDSGIPYYGPNANIHGHTPSDAFDSSASTFWMSIGNAKPNAGYAYEYVEGKLPKAADTTALKFKVWGGPYRCYVSVKSNGNWLGSQTVPYDPHNPVSAPNGSNIPYVSAFTVGFENEIQMGFAFKNVTDVRLTFTDLYNSGIGPYRYRAGVRSCQVNTTETSMVASGNHQVGNYGDYTDIVKLLLAYGGFYWPADPALATTTKTDGSVVSSPTLTNDPYLGIGRIWGDVEQTGTASGTELDVATWDKKTLLDGISFVRDIVSYIFFIDETGGAVWRSPNIWQIGNYVGDSSASAGYKAGLDYIHTIDETQTLLDITVTTSSRNVFENVFVANTFGRYGAVAEGYNPNPSGLRRVGGYTSNNFQSTDESQIMADLIALRQLFQYRTDTVVITGNPAIQIDDQVRIFERITNEGYIHYISGIVSAFDMETGEWTYTLTTNWLGVTPFSDWTFQPSDLAAVTQTYLESIGKLGGE